MTRKSVFISVANSEHAYLRDQLRGVLASEFDVIAQPTFPSSTVDVVRKLDREISKCDLLIHIVGQEPGTVAAAAAVKDYFDHVHRPQFLDRFPDASRKLGDCLALTYPQWEPWLALNQGKDVLVYSVAESMQPEFPQSEHLVNLRLARRHAHVLSDLETIQSRIVADVFSHFTDKGDSDSVSSMPGLPDTAAYKNELRARVEDALNSRKIREFGREYISRDLEVAQGSPIEPDECELGRILKLYPGLSLCGEAGDGKTSWCLHLVHNLLNEDQRLPILIECRRFSARLDEHLLRSGSDWTRDQILAGIRHVLKVFLRRPFSSGASTEVTDDELGALLNSCSSVIVIEGFDELQSVRTAELSTHELFAVALVDLHHSLSLTSADLVISSRPSVVHLLDELRMPRMQPSRIQRGDLQELFEKELISADEQERLAEIFFNKLAGKPLYLRPLIRFFRTIQGEISFLSLLIAENEALFLQNAVDCTRDHNHDLQKACLRQLALTLVSKAVCLDCDFEHLVAAVTSDTATQRQLLRAIPKFLSTSNSSFGTVYQFPHDEFRDFWLAESLLLGLAGVELLRPKEELVRLLARQEVLDKAVLLVARESDHLQSRIFDSLKGIINDSERTAPRSRRDRTTAALALGLLVRITEIGHLDGLQTCDKCFQGLDAREQRFLRVDFSRSSFGDARLQGAVFEECPLEEASFDNAELAGATFHESNMRGSILKNAGMGSYRSAIHGDLRPTQFVDCSLDSSDWFNFRISLKGYFQFWTARQLEGTQWLALASSNGELLIFDKQNLKAAPRRIATGHSLDLLDFDYSAETRLLVTISRDRTVRLCVVDQDWKELRFVARLNMPDHYPRCVAFSASGEWFGVTDRSGNVFFYQTNRFRDGNAADADPSSCRSLHTGPVMSLSLFPRGRDEFFTAGYDGRVVEHQRNTKGTPNWKSKEVVSFANEESLSTIRCMLPWKSHGISGIWIGDEAGRLRFQSLVPGRLDTSLAATTGSPVFRLGSSPGGERICAGLANGKVIIFVIDRGNSKIAARVIDQIKIPHGDIVRYCDFLDEDRVACMAWSGSFWVWSIRKQSFEFSYVNPRDSWDSSKDRAVLRISPVTEVDKIVNVSGTFKDYLKELSG